MSRGIMQLNIHVFQIIKVIIKIGRANHEIAFIALPDHKNILVLNDSPQTPHFVLFLKVVMQTLPERKTIPPDSQWKMTRYENS